MAKLVSECAGARGDGSTGDQALIVAPRLYGTVDHWVVQHEKGGGGGTV